MDAAIITALCNLAAWLFMFGIQNWEAKTGRIPHRRPHNKARPRYGFLYIQDYHTTSWGDLVALTLIDAVTAQTSSLVPVFNDTETMISIIFVTIVIATIFNVQWLRRNHKPDWAYPEAGKESWGGILHSLYFTVQLYFVVFGILLLITGGFSFWRAIIFVIGGLAYLLAMVLDIASKRWVKI